MLILVCSLIIIGGLSLSLVIMRLLLVHLDDELWATSIIVGVGATFCVFALVVIGVLTWWGIVFVCGGGRC